MFPPSRLITVGSAAEATSIAIPRVHVAPPSIDWRTMMSPELLMVRTSVAAGVNAPFASTKMPRAVDTPLLAVIASTLSEPEFEIVIVFAPPAT